MLGQLQFTFNPANGSIIQHKPGATNITIQCSIFDQLPQLPTQWNIVNFRGVLGAASLLTAVPSVIVGGTPTGTDGLFSTYRDYAVFTNYTSDLHSATVFCGFPFYPDISSLFSGVFHLRVYSTLLWSSRKCLKIAPFLGTPILLRFTDSVKYRNEEQDFVISLQNAEFPGYPIPTTFHWSQDGRGPLRNDSRREFGYPTLMMSRVDVTDSGRYSLTASNYIPSDPPELLGTSSGSFTLDVLCEC